METAIIPKDQLTNEPILVVPVYEQKTRIYGIGGPLAAALDAGGAIGEINPGGDMRRMHQKGYTLVEILVAAGIVFYVVATGLGIYVITHFIVKFW